jgi:hypothetical protein
MSEQPHEQVREHHLSRIRGLAMQRDLRQSLPHWRSTPA